MNDSTLLGEKCTSLEYICIFGLRLYKAQVQVRIRVRVYLSYHKRERLIVIVHVCLIYARSITFHFRKGLSLASDIVYAS